MSSPSTSSAKESAWSRMETPIAGKAESIGFYSNGCVVGATMLPERGQGFESIRRHRNRYYGHPQLVDFVQGFALALHQEGLGPILVGDLSQPAGGPMAYGHRSHQLGLDVDLWFTRPPPKSRETDEGFASMVNEEKEAIDTSVWSPRQRRYIELAAKNPEVARILVNWVVKKRLCEEVKGERGWLTKVRPWWGHDRHFHVRLKCPKGSAYCVDQKAPPREDDCGRERWFSKASVGARKRATPQKKKTAPKKKKLISPRCRKLLKP